MSNLDEIRKKLEQAGVEVDRLRDEMCEARGRRRVIALEAQAAGISITEIAAILDVSRHTVYAILR